MKLNLKSKKTLSIKKRLSSDEKNIWVIIKNKKFSIFMLLISSLIFVLGVNLFLTTAGTISTGLSAIPLLIIFSFPSVDLGQYFALILFGLNIPLIIIFWKKIKRSFFVLTIIWSLFQIVWNFILAIPVINNFLIDNTVGKMAPNFIASADKTQDTWAVLVFAFVGALLIGFSIAIAWRNGASSGGTDIIAYYFSTKRKISASTPLLIISLSISFISIIILVILSVANPDPNPNAVKRDFFGIRTLGTILYIIVSSSLLGALYPKYSKIQLTIHSEKYEDILQLFKKINYWHGYTISDIEGGYTNKKGKKIETVILLLEVNRIKNLIQEVDPKVWISIKKVKDSVGTFNSSEVE
ncbi:YitT family protein [[Mycoplasma] mobile]|nr:YitT family protein [[Mycoplasma] mobile]